MDRDSDTCPAGPVDAGSVTSCRSCSSGGPRRRARPPQIRHATLLTCWLSLIHDLHISTPLLRADPTLVPPCTIPTLPTGRDLYTELLAKATAEQPAELGVSPTHSNALTMNEINEEHLLRFFAPFPQTYDEIRRQELGFFRYTVNPQLSSLPPINEEDSNSTDDLLASKHILFEPLIYEDFLPASAAGIFQSNLSSKGDDGIEGGDGSPPKKQQPPILSVGPDQAAFEKAIGRKVVDEMELYARSQQESLDECARILGIKHKLYP